MLIYSTERVMRMAKINFILQGRDELENHKNSIVSILSKKKMVNVLISVAFARSEGVSLIKREIKSAVEDEVNVDVFVGIRNGITSKQALKKLFKYGVNLYVVDTGRSGLLFHPKVYMVECKNKAFAVVGSANLTNGGLLSNIEASSIIELNKNDDDDEIFIQDTLESFKNLFLDYPENVYKIDSINQIEDLYEEGKLIDEKTEVRNRVCGSNTKGNEDITPVIELKTEKPKKKKKKEEKEADKSLKNINVITVDKSDLVGVTLTEVWRSKGLEERDLNVPSGSTANVTGSMTLKKGEYSEIDHRHYFREEVFNNLNWEHSSKQYPYLEYAYATFYIIIEGVNYGEYTLKLKHDPRTDTKSYKQYNAMTHLQWGDAKNIIRNRNLLKEKMIIYKIDNNHNKFVIIIE